jgi:transglycosylase-like protein with SLT domain
MRNGFRAGVIPCAILALLLTQPYAYAAKAAVKSRHRVTVATGKHVVEKNKHVAEKKPPSVQIVSFPDTQWQPVKIIRGGTPAKDETAGVAPTEKDETAQIVTFADPNSRPVRVVRGDMDHPSSMPPGENGIRTQLVTFADPGLRPVTVLRGSIAAQFLPGIELFRPASESDLDRIAFAVDGAESSHGADPRMWRPEPNGPQGPMQVSAAAAIDIGGGNRFDMVENRQLGRAYLARMYRRYGNWPDAIAAYNWGPGNMDAWIAGGRFTGSFPIEVERYRNRVLRDAGFDQIPANPLFYDIRQLPQLASPRAPRYPTASPSPFPR